MVTVVLLANNATIALTGTGSIFIAFSGDGDSATVNLGNATTFLGVACTKDSTLELLLPLGVKHCHHTPTL